MRQTKQTLTALEDANIAFSFVDIDDNPHLAAALETILGAYSLPVLFVDGRAYKGVEKIRGYLRH